MKVFQLSLKSYMAMYGFYTNICDFKCKVVEVSLRVLSTRWFPLNHEQMLRLWHSIWIEP